MWFPGLQHSDLLCIELCAGTAVLSEAAAKSGFRTLSVDNAKHRVRLRSTVMLDLADPEQNQAIFDTLRTERDRIAMVFIAPPCGTASRARERPLHKWVKQGYTVPQPLRSDVHPDMLPGLRGKDRRRVELVNQLYYALSLLSICAVDLGILVVIENPANSLYWETSMFKMLLEHRKGNHVLFHSCAHGGGRPKLTKLWTSVPAFQSLQIFCDHSHSHLPWTPCLRKGKMHFVTSDEASYPIKLCQRLVASLLDLCFGPHVPQLSLDCISQHDSFSRIALGVQPRGNRLKPLVAEFSHYVACMFNLEERLSDFLASLPKGSRVVRRKLSTWGEYFALLQNQKDNECLELHFLGTVPMYDCSRVIFDAWQTRAIEVATVGVPCTPDVFIHRALKVGHPRGLDMHIDPNVATTAQANFVDEPYDLAKFRVQFVKKWSARAKDLQGAEDALHDSMEPHLKEVLRGKRLLLLGEMMSEAGCPDTQLPNDIKEGFRLSGWMPVSGNTAPSVKRPARSVSSLLQLIKGLNKATLSKMASRQDSTLESAAWAETQSEIDAGWVWVDDDADLSEVCVAMRFGVVQGDKIRVIDDCTICGLNSTIGLQERFELRTIDKFASFVAHAFSTGADRNMSSLSGRTFDLKSAYKQYGLHPFDRKLLRIAVNKPGVQKPVLLGLNSLPFGAVGSVSAFLRISYAVWRIGIVLCRVMWSAYFDDYSAVSQTQLADNTRWVIECLFDLLGINFAREGRKAMPFSPSFSMLGLSIDLSAASDRVMLVGHTDSRRRELTEYVQGILDAGLLSPRVFERLRGRMVFFESFSFGRVTSHALRFLAKACRDAVSSFSLNDEHRRCLQALLSRIASAEPLRVLKGISLTWTLFTDGACEAEQGTGGIGAVLFAPNGTCAGHFGESVPASLMHSLLQKSKNPIYELEIAPLVISLQLWKGLMHGSQLVCYLDNEGTRHSLIRCYADTEPADSWVRAFLKYEMDLQLNVWFARVPTASNVADGPSKPPAQRCVLLGRGSLCT